MENKKLELDELSSKVLTGLQKALVVFMNGEIKKIPAKELLTTLPE
jgi:hypothetical protein